MATPGTGSRECWHNPALTDVGVIGEILPFSEKRRSQSTVLIVNLELIGDYIVFEPRRNTYHNFLVRISEPDEERMGPLIDKEMEESRKSGKTQRSREELVRGLNQQVEVFAGFKAEINITRSDCVRQLDVEKT